MDRLYATAGLSHSSLRDRMESDISELNGPQLIDASVGATSNLVGLQLGADAIVLALCGGC